MANFLMDVPRDQQPHSAVGLPDRDQTGPERPRLVLDLKTLIAPRPRQSLATKSQTRAAAAFRTAGGGQRRMSSA